MNIQEAENIFAKIAEECTTPEEVDAKIDALSEQEVFALAHAGHRADVIAECQRESNIFLGELDRANFVYNKETGEVNRNILLGQMFALVMTYCTAAEQQARQELQTQTEHSQYGMGLSSYLSDEAVVLKRVVEDLIINESYYVAVLKGRKDQVHYLDMDGKFVPFTDEEAAAVSRNEPKQKKVMLTPEKFGKKEE